MKVEIISVGNELVLGELENINSSWMARELTARGFEVSGMGVIGDDEWAIEGALIRSRDQADAVITFGGLGPMVNDVTAKSAARAFQCPLILNHELLQLIRERFIQRGQEIPPLIEKQASLPQRAELIANPLGIAPGFFMNVLGKTFFFLPEIPQELKYIFQEAVLPLLEKKRTEVPYYRSKTFRLFGLSDFDVAEKLRGMISEDVGSFSFWPYFPESRLRIWVRGRSWEEVENGFSYFETFVLDRLGDYVFAEGSTTMEEVVGHLLRSNGATLAVAESCTGGLLGHRLTNIPGSSDYFERGIIAYSNQAKTDLLHVPEDLLSQCGAVSAPVAGKMAEGVRKISGATIGLGITGIAGPSGGTPDKPVGTVFIALANAEGTVSKKYQFAGDREQIKVISAYTAMDRARRFFLKIL